MNKELQKKIAEFEKCSFDLMQKHKVLHSVEKDILTIEDTKFYKSKMRKDVLQIKISDLQKRIASVKLFDRKSFEKEFLKEASEDLCCNSFAVAKNLAHKNQQYSTCYRLLARYSNRADLLLMCEMSKANQSKLFKSKNFHIARDKQIEMLTKAEIEKANNTDFCEIYNKQNYYDAITSLTECFARMKKDSKSKTSKLVKAKTKVKQIA